MAVSKYKSRDWISEITKLKRKLSINNIAANKKLDLAVHVARANIYYHPNSRHFRRLNTCLRKDPDLKEEHAKGKNILVPRGSCFFVFFLEFLI